MMAGPGIISLSRTYEFSNFVFNELTSIKQERVLTDFSIKIGTHSLPCHKLVLALHSPVLKAMLTTDTVEANTGEIKLDHIDVDVMKIVLDYMYSCDISIHEEQLLAVIEACDYLQVILLKDMCLTQVPAVLTPKNVMSFLAMAKAKNLAEIRGKCEEIMAAELCEISKGIEFLSLSFAEAEDCLSAIREKNVTSDDMLGAVMKWFSHDADSRCTHMKVLLQLVQLDNCTEQGMKVTVDDEPRALLLTLKVLEQIDLPKDIEAGKLAIVGGQVYQNGPPSRVCLELNQAQKFVKMCDIPYDDLSYGHSICQTPVGCAITGGEGSTLCVMFIASSRSWSPLQNMLRARSLHGSICIRGVIYVLGGNADDTMSTMEYLEFDGGGWQHGPAIPVCVTCPKLSAIDDSNLYLLDEGTNQLHHFNIDRKVWRRRPSFPGKVIEAASITSAKGKLCVAGGPNMVCALYDPSTNAWSLGIPPLHQHWYGALVHYNNSLLLLGGRAMGKGSDEVEAYDMENDSWSVCSWKMPISVYSHYALVLGTQ